MRRNTILGLACLLLLLLLAAWLLRSSTRHHVAPGEQVRASATAATNPVSKPTVAPKTDAGSSSSAPVLPPAKQELYEERARKLGEEMNRPVAFFGRIIDQDGKPVKGIPVKLALSFFGKIVRAGLLPSHSDFEQTTDAAGEFVVEGRSGLSLDVTLPTWRDYEFNPRGLQVMFQDEAAGKPAAVMSTREQPYVFHAYRKGKPEPLTKGAIAFYDCVPDGRPYVVRLGNSKVVEGAGAGDFTISFQRQAGMMTQVPYDWTVRIDGRDMELMPSNEEFMYTAPASGYSESWSYSQSRDATDFKREASVRFYVRRRNGSMYGRVELQLISDYRERSGFVLNYWENPKGSRNLE